MARQEGCDSLFASMLRLYRSSCRSAFAATKCFSCGRESEDPFLLPPTRNMPCDGQSANSIPATDDGDASPKTRCQYPCTDISLHMSVYIECRPRQRIHTVFGDDNRLMQFSCQARSSFQLPSLPFPVRFGTQP